MNKEHDNMMNNIPKTPESTHSQPDKRKQSLYFPETMLQEIKDEAARLDRSLSWIVQRAWKLSRTDIQKLPSVNELPELNKDNG